MKKSKLVALCVLAVAAISITACNGESGYSGPTSFTLSGADANADFNGMRTQYVYNTEADQDGEVRILVVPVEFTDTYSADNLPLGREGTIEALKSVFFGDPDEDESIAWESVASFYEKSSYGKLNITGTVLDTWWNTGMTARNFSRTSSAAALISEINDYYRTGDGADEIDFKDYDANGDGYVDLVYLIYSCPQSIYDDGDTFWAWCTQHSVRNSSVDNPNISRYIWASYQFMYEGGYYDDNGTFHDWTTAQKSNGTATLDAHTYIHEGGHGLGLTDYYSYDYNGESPLGAADMQDNNVGDNNAYSKTIMGWIDPTVILDSQTITLRSFELYGDALILPIREVAQASEDYSEDFSILGEYIMVQFDTPDGLAVADGTHQYSGNYPLFYNEAGVRIFHVDSRMGIFSLTSGDFAQYSSTYNLSTTVAQSYYVNLAHSNTLSYSVNDNRLIQLIIPNDSTETGGEANLTAVTTDPSSKMWFEGDVLTDWTMNTDNSTTYEKYQLGWSISIDEIDAEAKTCTITITAV